MITSKSYHELILIESFTKRFDYLKLDGKIGIETFGTHRYLNQILYQSPEWRSLRDKIIIRDRACDLAHPDYEIRTGRVIVHHINPLTVDDILEQRPNVFNMDNLITMSFDTHQAIHYGDRHLLKIELTERSPNDTCPWRK